ncbi:hypothetical protein FOC1_g10005986 [Fusarium oxysporum f. sp. cubense race 1]|uniref:Zn(2)-C6 fungal-type domain-containing protein n=1 Tax=Fusarium oxysporum f. sp. cubense (strain race 1) TaxID=1229664 RepID=N4TQR8_FUSC1|nr:hypothetical protein FOC1_g10005986 [Fusarium oxysporum f. sp. cubense race 1]
MTRVKSGQRQRARAPKVKTGCGTCKVKCDEARPACTRCTSTGRKCDGYQTEAPSPPAKSSPSVISSPTSVVSTYTTRPEARSFQFFIEKTLLLHGKTDSAISLFRYGCRMIQQFRRTFSVSRGHGSHTKSDVEATFNLADACFRRIAVQLLMLMGDVDAGLWSSYYKTFSNTLPPPNTSFSSLSDAREAILELLVEQASPGLKGKPIYETISHASKVEQWGQSFDNLLTELGNSGKSFSAGDKRAIALLQLHRKYLEINVAKYLHGQGDPCFWDRFTAEFDEIVNYAATAAGLDKNYTQRNWANDSPSEAYFHVDLGYTSVLVSVIARCRDPSVRRRAIAVMLAERVQEGVFNGSQSARVGARVMELEEARSGREVKCSCDIPEEARVRTIRVHLLGPENKKVKMVYGFDKGYWEEVREMAE